MNKSSFCSFDSLWVQTDDNLDCDLGTKENNEDYLEKQKNMDVEKEKPPGCVLCSCNLLVRICFHRNSKKRILDFH